MMVAPGAQLVATWVQWGATGAQLGACEVQWGATGTQLVAILAYNGKLLGHDWGYWGTTGDHWGTMGSC